MLAPKIEYQLHPDVVFIPAVELSEKDKVETNAKDGDYILNRGGARSKSKVITKEAREFLDYFKTPLPFVNGVARFAKTHNEPPEQVLDSTLPLFETLLRARFLFPAGSEFLREMKASYIVGAYIDKFRIEEIIQIIEDVEVYKVSAVGLESLFALKIARDNSNDAIKNKLQDEHASLKKLDGVRNPAPQSSGIFENKIYHTSRWIEGVSINSLFHRYNSDYQGDRPYILEIFYDVLQAFAHIHRQGCLHGDIHPQNIMVDNKSSQVIVIDFGAAKWNEKSRKNETREHMPFFCEPELAESQLAGLPDAPSSEAGEQYALAAVFYYLICNEHYADFSLERKKLLEQIRTLSPLPFHLRGKLSWPPLEKILTKALAKKPEERFADLNAFLAAINSIQAEMKALAALRQSRAAHLPASLEGLLKTVQEAEGRNFEELLQPPLSTIGTGLAGIAYAAYKLSWLQDNPVFLALADALIHRAVVELDNPMGLIGTEPGFTSENIVVHSFYYGASGVYVVQAIVAYGRSDTYTYDAAVENYGRFIEKSVAADQLDFLLGSGGLLLGCCLIEEHASRQDERLYKWGNLLESILLSKIRKLSMAGTSPSLNPSGIAHGWGGVLLVLMRWAKIKGKECDSAVCEKLNQLAALGVRDNMQMKWPIRLNDTMCEYSPMWSNGDSGMVHLWLQAWENYREDKYKEFAEATANSVWEKAGFGPKDLCCGAAGWAYAFLRLFRLTGHTDWYDKANHCLELSIASHTDAAIFPLSLYNGALGTLVLAEDMRDPEKSFMPLFESPT